MKIKKRTLSLLMAFCLAFSMFSATAFSYTVGERLGNVLYSDIVAYVNGYPLPSYNINGNLAVVAQNLNNYGLTVKWDSATSSSSITYEAGKQITPITVEKSGGVAGEVWQPYVYTDVRAFVNGKAVDSWNVGGNLVIPFSALDVYGQRVFNATDKASRLTLDSSKALGGVAATPVPTVTPTSAPAVTDKIGDVYYTSMQTFINGYKIPCYSINNNVVVTIEDLKSYGFLSSYNAATLTHNVTLNPTGKVNQLSQPGKTEGVYTPYTATSMKVTLNGTLVNSFSFGGTFGVYFSTLDTFGVIESTGTQRSLTTSCSISGRILTATGSGVANAVVELLNATGAVSKSTKADSSGNYSFENIVTGNYSIQASATGYSSGKTSSFAVTTNVTAKNLSLAAQTSSLSGTIIGSDAANSRGLANVTVTLKQSGSLVDTKTTSSVGAYAFNNIAAGNYTLTISKSGYKSEDYSVSVGTSAVVRDITMQIDGYSISGYTYDTTSGYSTALTGVTLRIAKSSAPSSYLQTITSGTSGSFSFTGLEGNTTYYITPSYTGYAPVQVYYTFSTGSGGVSNADIRLSRGSNIVTGSVYLQAYNQNWGNQGNLSNAKIDVLSGSTTGSVVSSISPVYTDSNGNFSIPLGTASGTVTYYLRVTSPLNSSYNYVYPTAYTVTNGSLSNWSQASISVNPSYSSISGVIRNIPSGTYRIVLSLSGNTNYSTEVFASTYTSVNYSIQNIPQNGSWMVLATAYNSSNIPLASFTTTSYYSSGSASADIDFSNYYNGIGTLTIQGYTGTPANGASDPITWANVHVTLESPSGASAAAGYFNSNGSITLSNLSMNTQYKLRFQPNYGYIYTAGLTAGNNNVYVDSSNDYVTLTSNGGGSVSVWLVLVP